jgi:integrase
MEAILKNGVRILRPEEYGQLRGTLKTEQQLLLDGMLLTGMRYAELSALVGHPEWLEGQFIKTHSHKTETRFKDRWIRLSDYGRMVLPNFIKNARLPSRQSLDETLKRWAIKAHLDPKGICCKTFRKTWESWLVFYYPSHHLEIATRQGHTSTTQLEYYLDMPFSQEDRYKMKMWIDGWIEREEKLGIK